MADAGVKTDSRDCLQQENGSMPGNAATRSAGSVIPRLAAIRIADDTATDDLLESVIQTLRQEGKTVAGFIQRQGRPDLSGHAEMILEDISGGRQYCISQPLGRDSRGCRMDPRAVADIAGPFLEAIATRPDLLVLNRFGKGESEGQGFRAVFEKAFLLGIPVLTSVKEIYAGAWEAFAADCSASLLPALEDVLDWSRAAVAQSGSEQLEK